MYDINEIDAKILRALLEDGRKNFSTIARECGTTKDVIWKHFRDMEKAGAIVGATIQINYQKFGYSGIAMMLLSVESQYVNEVFDRLKKFSDAGIFRFYNSKHNLAAITYLKNLRDLERTKKILSQNPTHEIKTYIWTDSRNTPENVFADAFENKNEKKQVRKFQASAEATKRSVKLDAIDMQIVEKLTWNGRMSFRKIAQEIGASTDTVARRYERLKENNFIKVSIQINTVVLGYQAILDINVALANQSVLGETAERICRIPGISYVVKISGDYDLQVAALVKDCRDIIAINEEIAKIPYIKSIDATLRAAPTAWPGPRQYITTF